MRKYFPFILCSLIACSGGAHMTMNSFENIDIGERDSDIVASVGQPYNITRKSDGTIEYEYIERIKAGNRDIEERCYVITLRDGKVVSKSIKYSTPAPYLWDSYDMQTSQRNESPPSDE